MTCGRARYITLFFCIFSYCSAFIMALTPVRRVVKTTKRYAKYDAELDATVCDRFNNANLTLTMRLGFRQINPAGGAASGTYHDYGDPARTARSIVRWTAGSWSRWKSNFVQSAQSFWNGKFWLVNNFPTWLEYEDGQTYRANVYCRFRLNGSDVTAGGSHHHTIDVVRLDPSESFFGSHSSLYDSNDTRPTPKDTDSTGASVLQRAHVHEIGHLLGMGHATQGSAACPQGRGDDTNADACYGTSDHDMHSVMGSGMSLYAEHAFPWRWAISDITGKGTVRSPSQNRELRAQLTHAHGGPQPDPTTSDWSAKMVRHYPRTLEEARLGQAITRRPSR